MVILFAWLLGGIIGAANRSGGMAALGPLVVGYIKDSFLSQLITSLPVTDENQIIVVYTSPSAVSRPHTTPSPLNPEKL